MKQTSTLVLLMTAGLAWASVIPSNTAAAMPPPAQGTWTSGSTGADGPLDFGLPGTLPAGITGGPDEYLIDLAWFDQPGHENYDSARWAMVFNYTEINVPAGVSVKFANHPARPPVVWLATGSVVIDGTVGLDGERGSDYSNPNVWAEPGPGGFRGGRGTYGYNGTNSAGYGPGGGRTNGAGHYGGAGSHATPGSSAGGPTYGSDGVVPLVGGSGGAGPDGHGSSGAGGAGGGAFLVAADGSITVRGVVTANGGRGGGGTTHNGGNDKDDGGGGSGGALRFSSPSVTLDHAVLQATGSVGSGSGYFGGNGRILIETSGRSGLLVSGGASAPDFDHSGSLGGIFPPLTPSLRVVQIDDGVQFRDVSGATLDPRAVIQPAEAADVILDEPAEVSLQVQALNIDPSWVVQARVVHSRGEAILYPTSGGVQLIGTFGASSCTITDVDLQGGVSAVQLRAFDPTAP